MRRFNAARGTAGGGPAVLIFETLAERTLALARVGREVTLIRGGELVPGPIGQPVRVGLTLALLAPAVPILLSNAGVLPPLSINLPPSLPSERSTIPCA